MDYLLFVYKWSSRELRKIIVAILKSWVANDVKKINYVQNYTMKDEKTIVKNEEKLLLINSWDEGRLNEFLLKKFSQLERVKIN